MDSKRSSELKEILNKLSAESRSLILSLPPLPEGQGIATFGFSFDNDDIEELRKIIKELD